jgi:hypothetical protein
MGIGRRTEPLAPQHSLNPLRIASLAELIRG